MRTTAFALTLLLTTALAARASAADDAIQWPLPWQVGTTLTYDKTTVSNKQSRGVAKVRNYADSTRISIVEASADGFLQRWTSDEVRTDSPGATPGELAIEREAVLRMSAIPLDVRLDAKGLFTRISNLGELQPVYEDIVRQGMERSIAQSAARIADPVAREQALVRARAASAETVVRMASEAALNNLVAPQPLSYNYFAVGGMVPGQRYEIEDLGENPAGGEPLPMLGSVMVKIDPADPRFLLAEWKMGLHPQKAAPLLWDALETLTRSPIPARDRQGVPSQFEIRTELSVRIESATGIVHLLRRIETRQVMDSREVKTTTMSLRR